LPYGRAALSRKGAAGDDGGLHFTALREERPNVPTKKRQQAREKPLFDPEASAPKKHHKSIKPSTQPFLTTFDFLVNLWSHGFSHNTKS